MNSSDIRDSFLKYFESRGHRILPSSPLVPQNDPTLLFTNAGMVQFKDIFTGKEKTELRRATTSQKCMRAGGKHNDLENVGHTARHHTFFEMLGNFSFGDYFKKDAIAFAWEYLTEVLRLDKERLYVTIYKDDQEAFRLWQEIAKIKSDRIYRMGEKDNFWAMGDTGPCGPCSEIIYDQGKDVGCKRPECSVGCDCDRFLEIWNLVFMQYERDSSGNMRPLPRPSIDTGMGLERLAAVLQKRLSNFDTDVFAEIIDTASRIARVQYHKDERTDASLRVIADHARAAAFLISDGILPSNEGRGYVLRRIIRRAIRHGHLLGIKETFFYKVCDSVIAKMGNHYNELVRGKELIDKATRYEEERFRETLEKGLSILQEEFERLKTQNISTINGETVFRLYDTYGFPVDLTSIIARENGFEIDAIGFEREMERQRERSEWKGSGENEIGHIYKELKNRGIKSLFTGYENTEESSQVEAIIVDGRLVEELEAGRVAEIVLNKTPFYGESGGQVGDTGTLESQNLLFRVEQTKKVEDIIIHKGVLQIGHIRLKEQIYAKLDTARRDRIRAAHSATHLLHLVLRRTLGSHVKQAGSLVEPDRLRFDFSHFEQIPFETLERIEEEVNRLILANLKSEVAVRDVKEAIESGAMALFGEKYGEKVRVVKMGDSLELCGGTHVRSTGEIGYFYITKESAIASGVRRIEAVCGLNAVNLIFEKRRIIRSLERLLNTNQEMLEQSVRLMNEKISKLEEKIQNYEERMFSYSLDNIISNSTNIDDYRILVSEVSASDVPDLRRKMDIIRERSKDLIILLFARINEKISIVMSVPKDMTNKIDASLIVREVSKSIGGTGGGRKDMAQGGGTDLSKIDTIKDTAIKALNDIIHK